MGLLDKAGEIQAEPAPKAKKKAPKVAKKAIKVDTPKPAKAAKSAKAAKPARATKAKRTRTKAPVDRTLPEEFQSAGKGNRAAAGAINFAWNWGLAVGLISVLATGAQPDFTIFFILAALMAFSNIIIIPAKWGRNIGQFASRTKYIRFTGRKPFFLHGILSNTDTLFFFSGLIMVATSGLGSNTGVNAVNLGIGLVVLGIPVGNYFFKRYSESNQTLWDYVFGAYLVSHVPSGQETGWAAKFERMGDFYEKRQSKAQEKRDSKTADLLDAEEEKSEKED